MGVRAGWGFTHLHKHPPAEPCFHQGLGHPAGSVRRRAVHLGVVLPREGTSAVCPPAAIGVHNDLSASDTGIPLRRKRKTRRVDVGGGVAETLAWPLDHGLETVSEASRSVCSKAPLAESQPETLGSNPSSVRVVIEVRSAAGTSSEKGPSSDGPLGSQPTHQAFVVGVDYNGETRVQKGPVLGPIYPGRSPSWCHLANIIPRLLRCLFRAMPVHRDV